MENNRGTQEEDFVKGDLANTLNAAVSTCSLEADSKSIAVNVSIDNCELLRANHGLLEQAFRNLLENAIRYSPANTSIFINLKKVDAMLRVSVKDEGPGIAPEHKMKVFERFYRVDKSRDRQTGGTGLGLSIVKHIVHNHGGEVKLDSVIDEGSCFSIDLPVNVASN